MGEEQLDDRTVDEIGLLRVDEYIDVVRLFHDRDHQLQLSETLLGRFKQEQTVEDQTTDALRPKDMRMQWQIQSRKSEKNAHLEPRVQAT